MKVQAIKTKKINADDNLFEILNKYLPEQIDDNSVIAVTSKIVAICEGRVKKINSEEEKSENWQICSMKQCELQGKGLQEFIKTLTPDPQKDDTDADSNK